MSRFLPSTHRYSPREENLRKSRSTLAPIGIGPLTSTYCQIAGLDPYNAPRFAKSGGKMTTRFAVIGSGAWGTAVAMLLAQNPQHRVCMWSYRPELTRELREKRENVRVLPG